MEIILNVIIFVLGLSVGSFINVCIYRIPREKSIVSPPSSCTSCGERIKKRDLIPVLSYIVLKGRCRNCGEKVSIKYPLIEILTGILFLLTFMHFGLTLEFIMYSSIISILIMIFFIDFEHMIIPDGLNLILGLLGITLNILNPSSSYKVTFLSMLYGFIIGGGFFFILALFGGMGGGDIKLMAALGLIFGWKLVLPLMFLSFLFGGIIGSLLLLFKSKGMKDMIPFGPYIVVASIVIIFYGINLINWYSGQF